MPWILYDIMVLGVPQWKHWSWMPNTCGLTHPLFNYSGDHKSHEYYGAKGVLMNECSVRMDSPTPSDLIWDHARGPKQIETVYHGPAAPFPWTCSAWDGAFGLQQCCSQLCKNLAVHAGSSSRSCARTRVRNHGCSIPRRNTRQHNELKQLKLNHGVGHISKLNQLNFLQDLKEVGGPPVFVRFFKLNQTN